jgi:hypothetical protein
VPRAKFTKPPGPFPAPEKVPRTKFRFRSDHRREFEKLLPSKLAGLSVPPDAARKHPEIKTISDVVILRTENEINNYLTGSHLLSEGNTSPVNGRAAIRRLRAAIRRFREALKPFERGWVDWETADIVPQNLDLKLEARDQELAKLRVPPAQRQALEILCQRIIININDLVSANGETISEREILRCVDAALKFANIKHPNISKHRDRLARLCFPSAATPLR